MPEQSPTVRQRRLGAELRRLRDRAEMTPDQAAAALGWSRPKLTRFETAVTRPQPADVEAMLNLYGGPDELKLALMQLARDIRKRGWWHAYNDVLTGSFAELEEDAGLIRSWQVQVIHGLLQTEGYARELIRGYVDDELEVDRRLQARIHRQTLLAGANAPRLDVIIDEAVLRRPVGGIEVMRAQFAALREAGRRPNVSVRVLQAETGMHPALGEGSFTIFDFRQEFATDVAYVESVAGGLYLEDVEAVRRASVMFQRIADLALSEEDSAAMVAAMM